MTVISPSRDTGTQNRSQPDVSTHSGFRPDIQGLRAVAVGLVVLQHFTGWPSGGFIGVDVFFVISGYLISDLLLRELDRTGRVSLREFYARRMRRIFPMAVIVLAATVAVAFALFSSARADSTLIDALWALVFLENWHLAQVGTDYFRMGDAVSPVQQYWSLSVEEQYYLVWPIALIALSALAGWLVRHKRHRAAEATGAATFPEESRDSLNQPVAVAVTETRWRLVAWTLGAVVLASFTWAIVQSQSNPTEAYFSTLTRAWELAAGALLAVMLQRQQVPLSARTRGSLMGLGLVAIIAAAVLINVNSQFPGPWAALPVGATMLILATGAGARGPAAGLMGSRPMQFVGAISYSLYLWHFPVMVFVFAVTGGGLRGVTIALVVSLALSVASYNLIEQPIRRSSWLSAKSRPGTQDDAARQLPPDHNTRTRIWPHTWQRLTLSLSVVALIAVALWGLYPRWAEAGTRWVAETNSPQTPVRSANADIIAQPLPAASTAASAGFDHYAALKLAQRQALETTTFPDFALPAGWDDVLSTTAVPECAPGPQRSAVCEFPEEGATKTAVLIGDSQMQAWLPGIRQALKGSGHSLKVFALPGCTASSVPTIEFLTGGTPFTYCDTFRDEALRYVETTKPDLVVVSSLMDAVDLLQSGAKGAAAQQEWGSGTEATLTRLSAASGRTVLLDSPPLGKSITDCLTRFASPDDCEAVVNDDYRQLAAVQAGAVSAVAAKGGAVAHVPVEDWFCFGGVCPGFIGQKPTYADSLHVSPMYGEYVAPLLRDTILGG